MFIQINGKPLNAFQLLYWYYKDTINEDGVTKYTIFYRITDGRVIREDFNSEKERQVKIDIL